MPVVDESKNVVPDIIPLNGVRIRCTRLTHPKPVQYESKKFDGKVCWRGVTDAFHYEMNGEGPFLHRRIVFQGPWSLSFEDVELAKAGISSHSWSRSGAVSLKDDNMATEVRRMFGASATIRDLLYSPVKAHGYSIVDDSRKQLEGKAAGTRKFQKYFKGFGKTGRGTVVKYNTFDNGETDGDVADDEKYHHIYAMDVFQYGINGLDEKVPMGASAGKKRGAEEALPGGKSKRSKSDESYDSISMDGLQLSVGTGVEEKPASGMVRVMSNMKLYWYDPK